MKELPVTDILRKHGLRIYAEKHHDKFKFISIDTSKKFRRAVWLTEFNTTIKEDLEVDYCIENNLYDTLGNIMEAKC